MQSKSLLVAVAAFALTATGVHAYGGESILSRAGLSSKQVSAIQEAQNLKANGDVAAARDRLVEAGITEETLQSIHAATKAAAQAMNEALLDGDYEAFKAAVGDGPLSEIITSEDDFNRLKEARELRQAGQWQEAKDILDELGIASSHFGVRHGLVSQLSEEQQAALQVARQANDRATMKAIFDEAGLKFSHYHGR